MLDKRPCSKKFLNLFNRHLTVIQCASLVMDRPEAARYDLSYVSLLAACRLKMKVHVLTVYDVSSRVTVDAYDAREWKQ